MLSNTLRQSTRNDDEKLWMDATLSNNNSQYHTKIRKFPVVGSKSSVYVILFAIFIVVHSTYFTWKRHLISKRWHRCHPRCKYCGKKNSTFLRQHPHILQFICFFDHSLTFFCCYYCSFVTCVCLYPVVSVGTQKTSIKPYKCQYFWGHFAISRWTLNDSTSIHTLHIIEIH